MNDQTKKAPNLTKAQVEKLSTLNTTSSKIRFLNEQGFSRGDIARTLNKRYQHVRNVLVQPLKGR